MTKFNTNDQQPCSPNIMRDVAKDADFIDEILPTNQNKSTKNKKRKVIIDETNDTKIDATKTNNKDGYHISNFDYEEKKSKVIDEPRPKKDVAFEKSLTLSPGVVGRRAPMNPFASPKLGKYRKGVGKKKVKDPKLNNNPLSGRLVITYTTSAIIIFIFLQELVYAYLSFNGRCVSPVLYPSSSSSGTNKPYIINIGYRSCEHNLDTTAADRRAVGYGASDNGWPDKFVKDGRISGSMTAGFDSPNKRIFSQLGALNANLIRNYNEIFRVFWSMFLHGGFIHLIINLSCQLQILWMIEPDWGFWRTALLFLIGGVSGNLLSAVADPCSITVGSSGAMYATLGALIPYCIEYWKTIPRPGCILIFMVVVIIIGIITGFTGMTDNFAHMGGCLGGILWGFSTIPSVSACDKCTLCERMAQAAPFRWFITKETLRSIKIRAQERHKRGNEQRLKYLKKKRAAEGMKKRAIHEIKLRFTDEGAPPCKMGKREFFVRITAFLCLIMMWSLCWIYLLVPSAYESVQPSGQLRFSGWSFCKCCRIKIKDLSSLYWCFGGPNGQSNISAFC